MFNRAISNAQSLAGLFTSSLGWMFQHKKALAIFALLATVNEVKGERIFAEYDCGLFELMHKDNVLNKEACYNWDLTPDVLYCQTMQAAVDSVESGSTLFILKQNPAFTACDGKLARYLQTDCAEFEMVIDKKYQRPAGIACTSYGDAGQVCWSTTGTLAKVGLYKTLDMRNTATSDKVCKQLGSAISSLKMGSHNEL